MGQRPREVEELKGLCFSRQLSGCRKVLVTFTQATPAIQTNSIQIQDNTGLSIL